jgi:hypothetical protein
MQVDTEITEDGRLAVIFYEDCGIWAEDWREVARVIVPVGTDYEARWHFYGTGPKRATLAAGETK